MREVERFVVLPPEALGVHALCVCFHDYCISMHAPLSAAGNFMASLSAVPKYSLVFKAKTDWRAHPSA